jgi:hypothetical protein
LSLRLPRASEVGEHRLGALEERASAVAFSLGWRLVPDSAGTAKVSPVLRFVPIAP